MEVEAQSMARGGDFNVDAAPAAGEGIYDCDEWLERERPPSIQALGTIVINPLRVVCGRPFVLF